MRPNSSCLRPTRHTTKAFIMPGSIRNVTALAVLPSTLCFAFSEARHFAAHEGEYPDGASQGSAVVTVSRKRFIVSKKLSTEQWVVLRDFYLARLGGTEAFYFYFGDETVPLFSSDPTGQNPTGRYTVRFEGDFPVELSVGRTPVSMTLIEIA